MALTYTSNSGEQFRQIADNAPFLISRHHSNGAILYVSPSSKAVVGYEPDEMIGRRIFEFVQFPDHDSLRRASKQAIANTSPQKLTYRVLHKNGNYVWLETTFKAVPSTTGHEILAFSRDITDSRHIQELFRMLARETIIGKGEDFFRPLVSQIAHALRVSYAFITETDPEHTRVRMLAFWKGDNFSNPLEYPLKDTPCDRVICDGQTCYYPVGIQSMFPRDADLVALNAQGYIGIPITNSAGKVIGHLAVLHDKPMKLQDYEISILKVFARHAATELERLQQQGA